jgi:adenine-specific DNA-methyltransferase
MAKKTAKTVKEPRNYNHSEEHPQCPEIGTGPHFKKKKPPTTDRRKESIRNFE